MSKVHDVAIIGGGFAGVTASRELSNRGFDTILLEARDRLGGRTWFTERLGREIELGGTYVHWNQPHMWAELTRYGLEIAESPKFEWGYMIIDGKPVRNTDEYMVNLNIRTGDIFLADAKEKNYFERPFDPYFDNALEEIDRYSINDRLKEIDHLLNDEERHHLNSLWSSYTSTNDLNDPGLGHAYRWAALTGHNMPEFQSTFEQYKIKKGTKALIEAIFSDSKAELKLSTPVKSVVKQGEEYLITSREGEEFRAKAVIVAVPVNVLNDIEFEPQLSDLKRAFSDEKQTSRGTKVWAKVRGLEGAATFKATDEYPINMADTEFISEDGTEGIIMGFGSDATLDMQDPKEVEKALRIWIPDIEVIESDGHNWVTDEFSKGTWGVIKKEQLSKYGKEMKVPEGGIFLAGSDFANGWAGYMDGAIETGLTSAKAVTDYLNNK